MGKSNSKQELEHNNGIIFSEAKQSGMIPDIGIDGSLVKFSGLDSAAELKTYSSELLRDLGGKAPDYMTNLGAALATFDCLPNAVGLGALVIAFMMDLIFSSSAEENSENMSNMVRRVFGEEKASGVRDSMDEYIKRLSMHVNEPLKALEETERLEKQLSDQLTRLRNSMLHDDQMSTRSMKHWTNGAAFHLQMLIHAARLKMALSDSALKNLQVYVASVSIVTNMYQKDLKELLKKYTSYKRSTMSLTRVWTRMSSRELIGYDLYILEDRESGRQVSVCLWATAALFDSYVDYMFKNWSQIKELAEYFAVLKKNIRELILQRDNFSMQNNLSGWGV